MQKKKQLSSDEDDSEIESINPQKSAFALLMEDDIASESESDSEIAPVQPAKVKASNKKGKNKKSNTDKSKADDRRHSIC